jgi:predicted MFS family arabinose efflux permease
MGSFGEKTIPFHGKLTSPASLEESWGWLIHRYSSGGVQNLQKMLAYACGAWGLATIGIAVVTMVSSSSSSAAPEMRNGDITLPSQSYYRTHLQITVRAINGAALGSILPLSQSLLVEYVPANLRGQAFGLMAAGEKLAGTVASGSVVYLGDAYWQYAYFVVGVASIVMGFAARYINLVGGSSSRNNYDAYGNKTVKGLESSHQPSKMKSTDLLSLRQIIQRIVRLPAFMCLVAQGVFGGTPWDMMSYLLLLMDWRGACVLRTSYFTEIATGVSHLLLHVFSILGFTKQQIVIIQFIQGIASMTGGWLGGLLGDYAAAKHSSKGRVCVALISVVGGMPLYGLFLYSTSFSWALLCITTFNLVATFAPAAAIRPICAELTNGPSERAQIVALWIVLEKTSGALFGAPLVGLMTDRILATSMSQELVPDKEEKARALAYNLFLLSSIFWGVCSFFWVIMLFAIRNSSKNLPHFSSNNPIGLHSSDS